MLRVSVAAAVAAALAGLASAATVNGTPRADVLRGTPRADVLDGRAGKDTISGLAGPDLIHSGPGRDAVAGGRGDDRIPSHGDGTRDAIRCGSGRDIVTADAADVVARDCEVVSRRISSDRTTTRGQHATQVEPGHLRLRRDDRLRVPDRPDLRRRCGGDRLLDLTQRGATWTSGLLPESRTLAAAGAC